MTNERARTELEQLYMSLSEEKKKALDVAFKAMEQAIPEMYYPQVDGITPTVVAQADGEKTCGTCRNEDTYHCAECENKSDYEQAQADGKYISLDSVIEWLKDKDIIKMSNQEWNARKELSELLIRHKADGEYISKACLKEAIHTLYQGLKLTRTEDDVQKCIDDLPSVAIPPAEPNTGHWIIIDDCEKFIAKCSECGQIEDSRMIGKYAYCHCGARMVEPQEGSKE